MVPIRWDTACCGCRFGRMEADEWRETLARPAAGHAGSAAERFFTASPQHQWSRRIGHSVCLFNGGMLFGQEFFLWSRYYLPWAVLSRAFTPSLLSFR